jgi:HSP20 family protein
VDIYEDVNRLVLKLEVPGISQEDLQIDLENQTLTVKGERKFVNDEKEENFHRIERRYGSFVRSFTLPSTVEPESTQASYENGVLAITLSKKEAAKPKHVPIQIGSGSNSKPTPKQMEGSRAA